MLQQELDSTRNERQIVLEAVTEMKETLNDLNDDIKASPYDKKALNIYYAIGLAETNTMENCINALRSLSQEKIEPTSTFRVLPEKAKLGVARILKKYPTQSAQGLPGMTNEKFLKCLEMKSDTDSLAEMELSLPITHDSCAFILFRWVMSSRENNSEKLCRIFPRLKNYGTVNSLMKKQKKQSGRGIFAAWVPGSIMNQSGMSSSWSLQSWDMDRIHDTLADQLKNLKVELMQEITSLIQKNQESPN
ncbi:hypothetical protein MAR_001018 [Mya arenaria]|uniref:Uncharacterized protein n=1 Tax=Mya arenaria TaxID=6604 RepID=A0ABY7FAP2_MYAAR|nr:hypothetical protein MAR_001018 [Mya arenaria]